MFLRSFSLVGLFNVIYIVPTVLRKKVSKRASAKIVYAAGRYYIAVENSARYSVLNVYAHKRILINSPQRGYQKTEAILLCLSLRINTRDPKHSAVYTFATGTMRVPR